MTLKELAIKSGMVITRCDKEKWGGSWGYKHKEYPNTTYNGYRTEKAAVEAYFEDTYGLGGLKGIKMLIRENERLKKQIMEMKYELGRF